MVLVVSRPMTWNSSTLCAGLSAIYQGLQSSSERTSSDEGSRRGPGEDSPRRKDTATEMISNHPTLNCRIHYPEKMAEASDAQTAEAPQNTLK